MLRNKTKTKRRKELRMSRPMPRGASVTVSRDHVGSIHVATTPTAIPARLTCNARYCMHVLTDGYSCKYLKTCVASVGKSCEMFKMPHVIGSRFSMIIKHSIKEWCRVIRGASRPSLTSRRRPLWSLQLQVACQAYRLVVFRLSASCSVFVTVGCMCL